MKEIALGVLSFNGLDTTKMFVEHLLKHTDMDKIHVIWVDNGSIDGTVQFLEKTKIDEFIKFSHNTGVIEGRNHIFKKFLETKCESLMFLDNDQIVNNGWLEQHLCVFENYDLN